jgi:hypothetical protein
LRALAREVIHERNVDKFAGCLKLIGRLAISLAFAASWPPPSWRFDAGVTNLMDWLDNWQDTKRGRIEMDTSNSKPSTPPEPMDSTKPNVDLDADVSINSRYPFYFPEVGDEVIFTRSPSHERETGYVMSCEYETSCIVIVDVNAKPLRLRPGHYQSAS